MIVKVYNDQFFPADMVLLKSSEPKGVCYVETKNLDGETNLKEKYVFAKDYTLIRIANELKGEIVCDMPNESLDEWDGNIHYGP